MHAWMRRFVLASVTVTSPAPSAVPTAPANAPAVRKARGSLGLVLSKAGADAPLVVERVFDAGPAQAAGLLAEDQIVAIDAIDTDTLSLDEALTRLRDPVGSRVTLGVVSGEDRFDLSIRRAPPPYGNTMPEPAA